MGIMTKDRVPPRLGDAMFALAQGEISDVLETPRGLELLYCAARSEAHTPEMAGMKDWLTRRVKEEKGSAAFNRFMKTLYENSEMEFLYKRTVATAAKPKAADQ